jgi:hypothetical protein
VHIRRRLTVSEAADELGISAEAVRSRVKRGTLRSTKEGGTVYVLLPGRPGDHQTRPDNNQTTEENDRAEDQTPPEHDRAGDQTELVESLLDQLAYMREQLAEEREARRRADTIMAQLSQANAEQARTIRALEAPRDARDEPHGPETVSETTERQTPQPTGGDRRRAYSAAPGGVGSLAFDSHKDAHRTLRTGCCYESCNTLSHVAYFSFSGGRNRRTECCNPRASAVGCCVGLHLRLYGLGGSEVQAQEDCRDLDAIGPENHRPTPWSLLSWQRHC